MHEHTIPESLVDQIKSGRAVLVVGAGVGVPSWKQLLERMTHELEGRSSKTPGAGDDAAVKDLQKLLSKGSLVRAIGFLARSLGEDTCDRIVAELWKTPSEAPALPQVLAELPFRHVWTTFPGDALERSFAGNSPSDWPPSKVVTYQELGELSRRRRTLVKLFGDFESYVVTPKSVRRALSRAVDLRDYAREAYVEGTLVFVGFRFGDPDLSALLDRVFGMFEPPRGNHYLIGAGVGPVTVDELMADHHIEVINVAGRGNDDVAEKSVVSWLAALRDTCKKVGATLHQGKPDADDLEGWLALLGDTEGEAGEARDAIDLIERRARESKDFDRVVELLLGQIDHSNDAGERATLLLQVADAYENGLSDQRRAFEALTTACAIDPANNKIVDHAERLAAAIGGWNELVAEGSEIATDTADAVIASRWWGRLGRWYGDKLDRVDYAMPSVRRALELDNNNLAAHTTLADLLRKQQKWAELADALRAHVDIEPDSERKIDLLLGLGDLCESQLAQGGKAIEAYQAAVDIDASSDDALAALERLYRREEKWSNLAKVLEQRADVVAAAGDSGRATAIRRELAQLRADKLGDLEGAIARHESALAANGADIAALKSLEELYEKTGRTDDYLRTLERLAAVGPEGERQAILRKLAAELEDRDGGTKRARAAYDQLLTIDPSADDAYRGLERLLRNAGEWYDLVAAYERHIAAAKSPAQRIELYTAAGQVHEGELADPHRAIESYLNALAIDENHKLSLTSLARLYQRTEAWDRAVDILVRHAALEGDKGASLWAEAGKLALTPMGDAELSARHLEKALSIDSENLGALKSLAELHLHRQSWANAIEYLTRAEQVSGVRQERVDLLWRAGQTAEHKLDDEARALALYERVLKLDPDHVDAGERVADRLIAASRWEDALPVLEMMARRADTSATTSTDRMARARREAQLGRAYEALHRHEKASRHYRNAVEIDPDSLDASLGLSAVLMMEAKAGEAVVEGADAAAAQAAAEALWQEVDRRYRDVLARHRTGLADNQVADIWFRLGQCSRALGDDRKAEVSYRRALEREPLHEATLLALVELGEQRSEWRTVIEAKRALAQNENLSVGNKAKLMHEIGDVARNKLKDSSTAVGAYLEGLAIQPGSHVLLHKLLEAYTEQKQWRRAVETLAQLAAVEASASLRARYHYTAAVIARDELGDGELAVAEFSAALDDAPTTPKALDSIDKLLTERRDYKNLARAYRKQLRRIGEDGAPATMIELWSRLGDIAIDHLSDPVTAMEAYQVACDIDPDDDSRREQLVELYIAAGASKRNDAIAELQHLIGHSPERVELYKVLAGLYRDEHELDKAWCVAQTLVFLGAASPDEAAMFAKYRPSQFIPATRRLTEELWQKSIIHPAENRHVGAIFASSLGALAATTAQPLSAFGLDTANRVDLDSDARVASRVVKYAAGVLALEPLPMVWLQENGDGLRVANTTAPGDRTRLSPSLLLGASQLAKSDERDLAFEIGKRLAYLRPERFVTLALGTLPKLETAFTAAVTASGAKLQREDGGAFEATTDDAQKLAVALQSNIPSQLLEQISDVGSKLSGRVGNGLVTGWRSGTDHTANRVGFILSNDLETAAKVIATENTAFSSLTVKERLRELLAYSVSESYFAVRRHLAIHVRDGVSA